MLILYPGHLMGKLSLLGAPIPAPYGHLLADAILALMLGLVVANALGLWTPVIVHLLGRFRWVCGNLHAGQCRLGLGVPKGMLGPPFPHAQTGLPVWVWCRT